MNEDFNAEKSSAGEYYDTLARDYNSISDSVGWPERQARLLKKVFELRPPESIDKVLDLGTGTGHTIDAILANCRPARIVAVDASAEMLDSFRSRQKYLYTETVQSSIEEFTSSCHEKFDLVTAMSCLEFVKDLPPALKQTVQLMGRNAVFAGTYIPRSEEDKKSLLLDSPFVGKKIEEYYWTSNEIEQSLTSVGLRINHRKTITAYKREEKDIPYDFIVATKE